MKQLTCIECPAGCRITVELKNGEYEFSGNKCARGAEFAKAELTAPKRSLTTTVRTSFHNMPVMPVRTNKEIPKEVIPDVMRALGKVLVSERIGIGEIVVKDILGSGCDVIATSDMLRSAEGEEPK
jgi:CxxC motif-containing protein